LELEKKSVKSEYQIRTFSIVGIMSVGLMQISLFISYRFGFEPSGDGSLMFHINQFISSLASLGYLVLLLGLWKSNAIGKSWFGRISFGLFFTGLSTLLIASLFVEQSGIAGFLYPVGFLALLFGGLLTGIEVIIEKHWTGWQRFALLLQGVSYIAFYLLQIVFQQFPSYLGIALYNGTWFITSLALFTKSDSKDSNLR